jgi:hypothetical protein
MNRAAYNDAVRAACTDPFRKIGEQAFDLRPLFRWNENALAVPYPSQLCDWHPIIGEVAGVTSNGVIVVLHKLARQGPELDTIWLRNYPLLKTCVDSDPVLVLAREAGRQQYRSPVGAIITVPAYDYGTLLSPEEEQILRDVHLARLEQLRRQHDDLKQAERQKKASLDARVLDHQKERAAAGSPQAQYDLAIRYLTGAGVQVDTNEARRLLELAAAQDFQLARDKLKTLANAPP